MCNEASQLLFVSPWIFSQYCSYSYLHMHFFTFAWIILDSTKLDQWLIAPFVFRASVPISRHCFVIWPIFCICNSAITVDHQRHSITHPHYQLPRFLDQCCEMLGWWRLFPLVSSPFHVSSREAPELFLYQKSINISTIYSESTESQTVTHYLSGLYFVSGGLEYSSRQREVPSGYHLTNWHLETINIQILCAAGSRKPISGSVKVCQCETHNS